MERFLAEYKGEILALTRIAAGFLFACHGAQKVLGLFGGPAAEMNALLWAAGGIELVGGALVCVGLFASFAAFVCSGQMAVAYFLAHQPQGLLPITNQGELAALYAWLFLLLAAFGGGPLSLDSLREEGAESPGG